MSAKRLIFLFGCLLLSGCAGFSPPPQPSPLPVPTATAIATEEYVVDGMAYAHVFTWEDVNRNGKQDEGEQPLPYVTTNVFYSDAFTDASGWATPSEFMAGCTENCSLGKPVAVKVPPGYKPTTPTQYIISEEDESYYFGFYLDNADAFVSFPNEPDWQKAFINRGTNVLAFHYEGEWLEITVDRDGAIFDDYYPQSLLEEDFYYGVFIFSVLHDLLYREIADVRHAQITLMPGKNVYYCEWEDILSWGGWVSDFEMLEQSCERVQ